MRRRIYIISITALIAATMVITQASAATWDVYPGQSIQSAIGGASSGDTIFVHAGTYSEGAIRILGAAKQNITLKGEGADKVTLDGEDSSDNIGIGGSSGDCASGCVVEGFKMINSGKGIDIASFAPDCIIRNCVFEGVGVGSNYGPGLAASNTTFMNNVVIESAAARAAIDARGDSCTIVNNTIINSAGAAIGLFSSASDITITRNNISGNAKGFWLRNAGPGYKIHLNDVINNGVSVTYMSTPPATIYWNSTEPIEYVCPTDGKTYTNYLGNYWSDHPGGAEDGCGIWATAYSIPPAGSVDYDYRPLMEEYENYLGEAPAACGCVGATETFGCGDTVTESCTFNGDMSCPSGHGLEIGEDGIVIDGNGYCIDGVSPGDIYRAGIYSYGHDNVTIKNMEVKNFCDGIRLKGIYDLDMQICTNKVENNTIDNCEVHDNGASDKKYHGIELKPCVWHSTVNNCTIYNNTGKVEGSCEDGGMGVRLHTMSNYNNITNNTIYGNRLSGIFSKMKCMYNYVAYNEVYENGHAYAGSYFGGGIRLMCLKTNYWTVEHNNVIDNIGPGILVGGKHNIVRCNNVTGSKTGGTGWSSGHGINICRNSEGNTVILNNCSENEGDGIAITSGQAMLEENTACDNGGYDIHVYDSAAATGNNNTCDTTYNYDDEGTTGCSYSCGVEPGCVAEGGTVYKCGDTVMESCTFNGDMSCIDGTGLIVGADDIVIDGNGYAIIGPGCSDTYIAGIYNYNATLDSGYDNVVIKNMEVKGFCDGIRLKGSGPNNVENNTIYNCEVHDNGKSDIPTHGIHLKPYVCNSTITNCEVYNNTGFVEGSCEDGGMGIRLHTQCNYNNITNNKIYGNRLSGIFSKMKCKHNYVAYNDVYENGHVFSGNYFGGGIRLECMLTNDWIVEHNNVTDNLGPGIFVRGDNNVIRYNNESGSKNAGSKAVGCAVSVGYGMYFSEDSDNNNITENRFCDNEYKDIGDDGTGNFGDENTCDTTQNYDDDGATGCRYSCEEGSIYDTGEGTYPSISGVHHGTITLNQTTIVSKMYTYPCVGTGGHSEYVRIYNESGTIAEAHWSGYTRDYHNITFDTTLRLLADHTYNYTIRTGSYPQIRHTDRLETDDGVIECTEFVDANGHSHDDWIPAIRLFC